MSSKQTNKQGVLAHPTDVCLGSKGYVIVSDMKGRVMLIRLRYPTDLTTICDKLPSPMGIAYQRGVVFIAC